MFDVKDGKLINVPHNWEGDFDCQGSQLITLEGAPEKVNGLFDCSHNRLTSLKGCPKEMIEGYGFPAGAFNCSDNPNLEDISDLASMCKCVLIEDCPKITKFPPWIDDTLAFICPTEEVRQRIKETSHYEVIEEHKDWITVRQKSIGEQLLDEL